MPLHEDGRHLTTFITPWGRYRYKSAPQGYIASGDGYSRRFDEIVSHIPNKTKCIDDALLWADDLSASFFQAVEWLDICGRHGITLNTKKFIFGEDKVDFAGFEITSDIRSWFGLVNQVAYAFAAADRMLPFRKLLKPGVQFCWDDNLDKLFQQSKIMVINEIEEACASFINPEPPA